MIASELEFFGGKQQKQILANLSQKKKKKRQEGEVLFMKGYGVVYNTHEKQLGQERKQCSS